jgi:dTDP-4-dehydrorhamnose reductase
MYRLAILGATGYVGSALREHCSNAGVSALVLDRNSTTSVETLRDAIRQSCADGLINCAGYTGKPNVDACELHKTECLFGNSVLPGLIRQACEELKLPWGHVSSGCIFTGSRSDGTGFCEEDPPNFSFRQNNCSFYSGCKALGEEVLEGAQKCYVWRLRIPFENTPNPRNYLQKLISYQRLLDAENSLSQLDEFVAACLDSFQLQIPYGTYNLTNPGSVWTHEVVELIKKSGVCSKTFDFFESEAKFMAVAAKTPRSNCVMDSSKAIAAGLKLTPVCEAIEQSLRNWST